MEVNNSLGFLSKQIGFMNIRALLLVVLGSCAVAACEGIANPCAPENECQPLQTSIKEVRVEPNPVLLGDSTLLTVVIEDSLDASFRYRWYLQGVLVINTDTNSIWWVQPTDTAGSFSSRVRAENGITGEIPPSRGFTIVVTQQ